MTDWKAKLKALGPCPEAYRWACQFKTLWEAWRMCERGDWMWWLLDKTDYRTAAEISCVLDEVEMWCELDTYGSYAQVSLREAYIILDFMPDPPKLPEVEK
jgi:hypothetical protein